MKRMLCLGLFVVYSVCSSAQMISTVAGDTAGFAGDGDTATQALLSHPFGICTDNSGNIYIADRGNARIRMINMLTTPPTMLTIAGTGTSGYNGDNIAANTAQLNDPVGVAADNAGNVYIADRGNNRIRKVNASGIITTIAGTGTAGYSGDSAAANLAQINAPRGVTIGPDDNIYIADQSNHRIRKINSQGMITTVAGNGTGGYGGDGAAATSAMLNNPANICFDLQGNMYIADVDNERIRKVDLLGNIITVAGNGTAGFSGDNGMAIAAELNEPTSVAVDNMSRVYIADGWNNRIRMVNTSGVISTIAGNGTAGFSGDGGAPAAAALNFPYGVAYDGLGNIYVADYENNRIRFITNPTGVAEVAAKNKIEVYPNPSAGNIKVNIPSLSAKSARVVISNVYGAEVKAMELATNTAKNMQLNLPAGVYMLHVSAGNEQWHEKIVIE